MDSLKLIIVPNYTEFSAKNLWLQVRNNSTINVYFPNYRSDRFPNRDYLLNVSFLIDFSIILY